MKRVFFTILVLPLFCTTYISCSVIKFAKAYRGMDGGKKGGEFKNNIFWREDVSYEVGNLSKEWKRVQSEKGDLLFWNPRKKAVITVNSICDGGESKYSLQALSDSLVIGIKRKKLVEKYALKVDDIDALYSRYIGTFKNQKIHLATVVFKTNSCVYDTSFVQLAESKDVAIKCYLQFVGGFRILSRR